MNLDLKTYSTFRLGGTAHKIFIINTSSDIEQVLSYGIDASKQVVIIGEGSNSIFADTHDSYILALMKIKGFEKVSETDSEIIVRVGAGELWDDFVSWAVAQNYSGIEALSLIPGTVGASPIQNIGAYGSEVSDTVVEIEVFDRKTSTFEIFSNQQCKFDYRDSIFKQNPHTYIITHVIFKLSKSIPQIPQYKDVLEYFSQSARHSRAGGNPGSQNPHTEKFLNPSIKQIRDAIISIRTSKLPDYQTQFNCGSFFKNPVISKEHLDKLQNKFPNIPAFELPNNMYKIFAGWILEHIDYQSIQTQHFYLYPQHKLVLIHDGFGTSEEFKKVVTGIIKEVKRVFDVELEIEPNVFE